jgi:nucleoside-diphosphate kinase
MSNTEQTLSIIKPDAVERNLENEIQEMFKNNGFSIVKEKKIQIEK